MKKTEKGSSAGGYLLNNRLLAALTAAILVLGTIVTIMDIAVNNADASTTYNYVCTHPGGSHNNYPQFSINGMYGTCCQADHKSNSKGKATMKKVSNSSTLSKVAYYYGAKKGYGPKFKSYKNSVDLKHFLQWANDKAACKKSWKKSYKNYKALESYADKKVKAVSGVKVPDTFIMYKCDPASGAQDFVVWKLQDKGSITLEKSSEDPKSMKITGYNSLKGVTYKIYKAKSAVKANLVGTLTCNKNGTTNTVKLAPGKYYIQESASNSYYKLDKKWIEVTVKENKKSTVKSKDEPIPVPVKIRKKISNDETVQGTFTIVMKSKENPSLKYTVKVKGNGDPVTVDVLAGQYTVTEKPSEGYIDETGSQTVTVKLGKTAEINRINRKNEPGSLQIIKETDDDGPVAGFRFKVSGILDGGGTMTAEELIRAASPKIIGEGEIETGSSEEEWAADAEDLKALNEAAASGKTGVYEVSLRRSISDAGYSRAEAGSSGADFGEDPNDESPDEVEVAGEEEELPDGTIASQDPSDGSAKPDKSSEDAEKSKEGADGVNAENSDDEQGGDIDNGFDAVGSDNNGADSDEGSAGNDSAGNADEGSGNSSKDDAGSRSDDSTGDSSDHDIGNGEDTNNTIRIKVKVDLKTSLFDETHKKYSACMGAPSKTTEDHDDFHVEHNDLEWMGAAPLYSDDETGARYSILTTDETGSAFRIGKDEPGIKGLLPGVYTAEEMMTDSQQDVYYEPKAQVRKLNGDQGETMTFQFTNNAKTTPVKLRKKCRDGRVSNIEFRLTGTDVRGEAIELTDRTNDEGLLDFGDLYGGDYVVEELSFDEEAYTTSHWLEGYDNPAVKVHIEGTEEEPVTVEFTNEPRSTLYITKVDSESGVFLEGGEFRIADSKGNTAAEFAIEKDDDGAPRARILKAGEGVSVSDAEALQEQLLSGSEQGDGSQNDPEHANAPESDLDQMNGSLTSSRQSDAPLIIGGTGEKKTEASYDTKIHYTAITGLKAGEKYTITEIKTPEGYSQYLKSDFDFSDRMKIILENQMPLIETAASDMNTGDHQGNAEGMVTIIDKVRYENLTGGRKYMITGTLALRDDHDAPQNEYDISSAGEETEEEISADDEVPETAGSGSRSGNEMQSTDDPDRASDSAGAPEMVTKAGKLVTSSVTFTAAEGGAGVEDVVFELKGSDLKGRSVVVFESLKDVALNTVTAVHSDMDNENQTVDYPEIQTSASAADTGDNIIGAHSKAVIRDIVKYTNLAAGKEYKLKGVLADKKTGKPVLVNGKKVTAEKTFVPQAADDGSSEMSGAAISSGAVNDKEVFNDAAADPGQSDDAFSENRDQSERELTGESSLTISSDFTEEESSEADGSAGSESELSVIIDHGVLQEVHEAETDDSSLGSTSPEEIDKDEPDDIISEGGSENEADNAAVADKNEGIADDLPATKDEADAISYDDAASDSDDESDAVWKGQSVSRVSGFEEIVFEFDAEGLEGKTLVAFEELYTGGDLIGEHKDINSEAQSVHIPRIRTSASDKEDGDKMLEPGKKAVVSDKVSYKNLLKGKTYKLCGELIDKETGKSTGIKAEKELKVNKTTGSTDLEFKFDAEKYAGKKLVAYEVMKYGKTVIAEHKDVNDSAQTVTFKKVATVRTPVQTGGPEIPFSLAILGITALMMMAALRRWG